MKHAGDISHEISHEQQKLGRRTAAKRDRKKLSRKRSPRQPRQRASRIQCGELICNVGSLKPSPSHHEFIGGAYIYIYIRSIYIYIFNINHSQSWVVYNMVFPTNWHFQQIYGDL